MSLTIQWVVAYFIRVPSYFIAQKPNTSKRKSEGVKFLLNKSSQFFSFIFG